MNRLGIRRVLVSGASGKLGRAITAALVNAGCEVRVLGDYTPVHLDGVELFQGSVSDPRATQQAVAGIDAICQLTTTMGDPETFFEASVRAPLNLLEALASDRAQRRWRAASILGTLNLLEAAWQDGRVKQFLFSSSDAAMGVWFCSQLGPINEAMPLHAYPGRYAFTKVIEEVMCQQYALEYRLPYTCLRASWIFRGDDILKHLSLTRAIDPDRPIVSSWDAFLNDEQRQLVSRGEDRVPILVNGSGIPYRRHIVHIDDVVQAWLLAIGNPVAVGQTFHIAAPSAFSYDQAARYLSQKTGVPTTELVVPGCHSFEIDISRARSILGYRPAHDIYATIDMALEEAGRVARRRRGGPREAL